MNSLKWMAANAGLAVALVAGTALAQQPASDQPPAQGTTDQAAQPSTTATPPAGAPADGAAAPAADPAATDDSAKQDELAPTKEDADKAAKEGQKSKKKAKKPQ